MDSFSSWLALQLQKKQWRQADLARASNLDSAVISNLINGRRGPGEDTCRAIAKALNLPLDEVFRAAGMLPPATEMDKDTQEMVHLFAQMSDEDREAAISMARFFVERRANKKPGQVRPAEV